MAFSSIKRKKCKCSIGCLFYPSLGYSGYYSAHAPKEIIDKVGTKRDVARRNKDARNKASNLLKKDSDADKAKLLIMADKLFGDFIKKRDSDTDGNITCICCGKSYNVSDKTNDGSSYI